MKTHIKVIVINGKPGSGKDTFVNNIIIAHSSCTAISTIDQELIAAKTLGWDGKKDDAGRGLLYNLKKAKTEYNKKHNCPMDKYVIDRIQWAQSKNFKNLFVHCREPEEIKKMVQTIDDCVTVLIRNERTDNKSTSNPSDKNVDDYPYDYIIHNDNGLEDFYRSSMHFANVVLT